MTDASSTPMPAPSPRSRAVEFIIKAAITVGLLGFMFTKVEFKTIAAQVTSIGLGAFILSTGIIVVLSLLVSLRWQVILNEMNAPLGFWQCWRLVMIGLFFNQTLPSSIGGDAVRVWVATRLVKSLRVAFVSVVVDRLFALVAIGVCIAVALPVLLRGPEAVLAILVTLMAVLCSIGLFGLDAVMERLSPLGSRFFGKGFRTAAVRPVNVLRDLSRVFGLILRRPRSGTAVLGISALNQISLCFVVYLIANALNVTLSLNTTLEIFPLAMLLSMVPISLGGWGVREASMVWLFGGAGVQSEQALSISVLFGLATTAAGLPGGLLWFLDRRSTAASSLAPTASIATAASVASDPRIVSQHVSTISPWVTIVERRVTFGDDRVETYHAIDQADYVAILAVTPEKRIPIVRQYRPALQRFTWELPAGMVDADEVPETTCVRELAEETGLIARRVHRLGVFAADSARLCNSVHSFLIETEATPQAFAELQLRYVTWDELQGMILAGQIDLQYHVGVLGLVFLRPELMHLVK